MKLHAKLTGVILIAYIVILPVVDMFNINSMCEKPLLNSPRYDIYCHGNFETAQVIIQWNDSSPEVGGHLRYCLKPDSPCDTDDTQNNTQIRMHYHGTQLMLYMHGDHIISGYYTPHGIHEIIISTTMEVTHVMYIYNGVRKNSTFPYKVNEPKYSNITMRNAACIGLFYRKTGGDKGNKPVCKELQSSDQLSDFINKGYKLANPDRGERNTNNDGRSPSPKDSGGTIKDTLDKDYKLANPGREEKNTNNDGRSPSPEVLGGAIKDTIGITESRIWNGFMIVLLILILILIVWVYRYIKRHWNKWYTSPKEASNSTDTFKVVTPAIESQSGSGTTVGPSGRGRIYGRNYSKGQRIGSACDTEMESSGILLRQHSKS